MKKALKKALFIDRDGTLIVEPPVDMQVDSLAKLEFVPGAISALKVLRGLDFELVMATNQDGLGTDSFPEEDFRIPQEKMLRTLAGEGVLFDDMLIDRTFESDGAPTRKPRTGMFGRYTGGGYDLDGKGFGGVSADRPAAETGGAPESGTDTGNRVGTGADNGPDDNRADTGNTTKGIRSHTDDMTSSDRAGAKNPAGEWNNDVWNGNSSNSDGRNGDNRNRDDGNDNSRINDSSSDERNDDNGNADNSNCGDGISTGLRFLDHMLAQIAHHGGVALEVEARGDLDIDEHHTMEDVAIVLGEAIDRALGSKAGIGRYGFALPMDDCRALVLLDFGGRIDFEWDAEFRRERVGDVPTEMFRHFFHSLCCAARCNLQIAAKGDNDHHKAEAIFKAFARALRMAVARSGFGYDIPSSKGVL